MSNFKVILASFIATTLLLWIGAFVLDALHPQTGCMQWETEFWRKKKTLHVFDRVSSFYWSSLCSPRPRPLIVSASEGTGPLSFAGIASRSGIRAHEIKGAHRGLKTAAYLFAHSIHSERLENLRALVFINPVYFSFAATTDSSSVSLSAISNLSYVAQLPTLVQKWDEFFVEFVVHRGKNLLSRIAKV